MSIQKLNKSCGKTRLKVTWSIFRRSTPRRHMLENCENGYEQNGAAHFFGLNYRRLSGKIARTYASSCTSSFSTSLVTPLSSSSSSTRSGIFDHFVNSSSTTNMNCTNARTYAFLYHSQLSSVQFI